MALSLFERLMNAQVGGLKSPLPTKSVNHSLIHVLEVLLYSACLSGVQHTYTARTHPMCTVHTPYMRHTRTVSPVSTT